MRDTSKLPGSIRSAVLLACGLLPIHATNPAYIVPTNPAVSTAGILNAGESVGNYRMAGTPDGLGAFDNGDGTFTVLMNHEFTATEGVAHTHNASLGASGKGSFVSEWVIRKSDLTVLSGGDLIQNIFDDAGVQIPAGDSRLNLVRFCSGDLAPVSAFSYGALGTTDRIYMNGEETGGGRAFAHVVTGPYAHSSFQLGLLGRVAFENSVASPFAQEKTIVASTDDTTPSAANTGGRVYIYVGAKKDTGTPVDKAGLTDGVNYAVQVDSVLAESRSTPLSGRFSLVTPSAAPSSSGGTQFLRPEDIAWDPNHANDLYFVTTDRYDQVKDGVGLTVARSRLYRLRFDDITNPGSGGTIEALLDGTEAGNMFDNIAVDHFGRIILLEDVGGQAHNGKVFMYDIATDTLTQIAKHDPAKFGDIGLPATAPFTQDEETSGVIDVSGIFGPGTYLLDDQAHYPFGDSAIVEGGQLMLLQAPVAPTVKSVRINDGSAQRSKVNEATVTLRGVVPQANITAGAFSLTRVQGGTFTVNVKSVSTVNGETSIILGFTWATVGADGSLPDGTYSLSVDPAKVTDQLGQTLDSDKDGFAGGPVTEIASFSTLFGDLDGDGQVSGQEVAAAAKLLGAKGSEYLWYLDFDANGSITGQDQSEVARRNGVK